jgi:hypothetical protein
MRRQHNPKEATMAVATLNNCTETNKGEFTAEASTMGLPPGQWPTTIVTYLGNKQPFVFESAKHDGEGDLMFCLYTQAGGSATLTIFND